MSNYHDKYLKYKKKYVDLKNEDKLNETLRTNNKELQNSNTILHSNEDLLNSLKLKTGGGAEHVIFFYDNTNPLVNGFFSEIKKGYMAHVEGKNSNLNEPYITNINFDTNLNLLLNIFTYQLKDNKVKPLFKVKIENLSSNRMTKLRKPFKKAVKKYRDVLHFNFNDKTSDLKINNLSSCYALSMQVNKIMNFINSQLNNTDISESLSSLLQIVKLYQELTTQEIFKYQMNRIGGYIDIIGAVVKPAGISNNTTIENIKDVKQEDVQRKLKEYADTNLLQLDKLVLNINNLSVNNINDVIYLKMMGVNKDGSVKVEVINIFDNPTNTQN